MKNTIIIRPFKPLYVRKTYNTTATTTATTTTAAAAAAANTTTIFVTHIP